MPAAGVLAVVDVAVARSAELAVVPVAVSVVVSAAVSAAVSVVVPAVAFATASVEPVAVGFLDFSSA